jgi:hypothetical protein
MLEMLVELLLRGLLSQVLHFKVPDCASSVLDSAFFRHLHHCVPHGDQGLICILQGRDCRSTSTLDVRVLEIRLLSVCQLQSQVL